MKTTDWGCFILELSADRTEDCRSLRYHLVSTSSVVNTQDRCLVGILMDQYVWRQGWKINGNPYDQRADNLRRGQLSRAEIYEDFRTAILDVHEGNTGL